MELLKYKDFLTEKVVYNMILESKVIYSNGFINMLDKMKSNKIAIALIKLYTKDIEPLNFNYVDVTDQKDEVSFTPSGKAKEIEKDNKDIWEVIDSQRYLTHGARNNRIFKALGYEKDNQSEWVPDVGTTGKILRETISGVSGKVYALFEGDSDENEGKLSVINKVALRPAESAINSKVWKTSRNPIKIGRLSRAILTAAKISFTDKDIENFTNLYKATFDSVKDNLNKFDIVKGNDISNWYHYENYKNEGDAEGTLGSSCMTGHPSFLKIYTKNEKKVRLLVLLEDGKICGRSLVWKLDKSPCDAEYFMDRVYTNRDYEVNKFTQYAEKNGWLYKQSMTCGDSWAVKFKYNRKEVLGEISVKIDGKHPKYPYMDTLFCLNKDKDELSNVPSWKCYRLWDTDGDRE